MKIGLFTIHKSCDSFGAALQAYATYRVLTEMGHNVEIIDAAYPKFLTYLPSKRFPTYNQHNFYKSRPFDFWTRIKHIKSYYRFHNFNKLCKYSRHYYSYDSLYRNPPKYDLYVTGSDQVWNPTLDLNIEPFLLTFAPENARRISYASSIGLDYMPGEFKEVFINGIKRFQHVSVREEKAKETIQQLTGRNDIEVVLDPTMLIPGQQWRDIAKTPVIENYVLCFCLQNDRTKLEIAIDIANKKGKQLIVIGRLIEGYDKIKYINDAGPLEWLGWISNADFIFTDSFHGTAFSINFHKQFLTYISDKSKSTRIINLLNRLDIKDGIYDNIERDNIFQYKNYDVIECKLEKERQISIRFINHSI